MTATERLRALLDERGVEWWETTSDCHCVFTWWKSPTFGNVHAMDNEDGTLFMACLNNCDFTPEQAVEATLGRGTCKDIGSAVFECSECGCKLDLDDVECEPTMWVDGVATVPLFCPNCGRAVVS